MWHREISVSLRNLIPSRSFSVHQDWILSSLSAATPVSNWWHSLTEGQLLKSKSIKRYKTQKIFVSNAMRCLQLLFQHWSISALGVTRRESNGDGGGNQRTMSCTSIAFYKFFHMLPGNCKYFSQLLSLQTLCRV